ncbi:MAG: single-stranded-DNA-specific exonuclease RecJ [Isosphaeraceae bacterium]|jgi:single-stranded-DNA-specific exonuclease|nr:MAG: single-stranded-DNA-specific exonuclease RecJ [Isosphaeraceae bacterium]
MATEWQIAAFDETQVRRLHREAGVHPLVAQLLLNRGIRDASAARSFLSVRRDGLLDPSLLPGAVEAAERIVRAIRQQRKIVIFGDYDVDGVCGTSLLWNCLRLAGASRLDYYIPHRVDEGYGLNAEALEKLRREQGAELVVTVDCGVSAVAEAELARQLGLELIITDHHTPGPDWPRADVVVHPQSPRGSYPFPDLCGAGVAFKLAWQICKSFGDGKKASPHLRDFLVEAINLVALATVADVVPLERENRIFVKHGLTGLAREPSIGLRALLDVSQCRESRRLSTGTIGFGLAPRINAAGRMDRACLAVELLTTTDPEHARRLAEQLEANNRYRQEIERTIVAEAREQVEAGASVAERGGIVVGRAGWHPGVIGIVASRLVDHYHRPTVVLSLGGEVGQGSARSIPGFDLYAALTACRSSLLVYGGHRAAAGLKLDPARLGEFAERFDAHCLATLTPEQRRRVLRIDAETRLADFTPELVRAIEDFEPYGLGNPRPVFLTQPIRLVEPPRVIGETKAHLSLRIEQGGKIYRAVAWSKAESWSDLQARTDYAVVFEPMLQAWNGRESVEFTLRDLRPLS